MTSKELLRHRVVDLVRTRPQLIWQFADLGIGPRYLDWTLESAVRDLGINLDRVVSRLFPYFKAQPAAI